MNKTHDFRADTPTNTDTNTELKAGQQYVSKTGGEIVFTIEALFKDKVVISYVSYGDTLHNIWDVKDFNDKFIPHKPKLEFPFYYFLVVWGDNTIGMVRFESLEEASQYQRRYKKEGYTVSVIKNLSLSEEVA